jgi:hypothetical protein
MMEIKDDNTFHPYRGTFEFSLVFTIGTQHFFVHQMVCFKRPLTDFSKNPIFILITNLAIFPTSLKFVKGGLKNVSQWAKKILGPNVTSLILKQKFKSDEMECHEHQS